MNNRRPSRRQMKTWRKLQQKKYRQESGLFLAEGQRCVEQVLRGGKLTVEALLRTYSSGWQPPAPGVDLYELEVKEFNELTDTQTPQGIAAVCKKPAEIPVEQLMQKNGIVLATDAIRDPGNLGTMIRTAVWFGASGLVCGGGTVDPWSPKVVRSAAGATGGLAVTGGDLQGLLEQMENGGWQVLLLDGGQGSVRLKTVRKTGKTVLVVGNEARGIDPGLRKAGRTRACIGGDAGAVESLNAAIALGIALYELNR